MPTIHLLIQNGAELQDADGNTLATITTNNIKVYGKAGTYEIQDGNKAVIYPTTPPAHKGSTKLRVTKGSSSLILKDADGTVLVSPIAGNKCWLHLDEFHIDDGNNNQLYPPVVTWPPNVHATVSDGSQTTLQNALSGAASGESVVVSGGTYNLTSNVTIPNGVHLHASGAATFTGDYYVGNPGGHDWTITSPDNGQSANSGFTFNVTWVNAEATTGGVLIANNIFVNQPSRYTPGHGSCISISNNAIPGNGADGCTIVNNDFSAYDGGAAIGLYGGPNNLIIDGNHFDNGAEGIALHSADTTSRGNGLLIVRNTFNSLSGPAMEIGPNDTGVEHFVGEIAFNWVDNFDSIASPNNVLPYSFVALAAGSTVTIHDNYARCGTHNSGASSTAIELVSGEAYDNVIDGFQLAFGTYVARSGGAHNNVHDNSAYYSGTSFQWNSGGGSDADGSPTLTNNTTLSSAPTAPDQPTRIATSIYYP